MKKKAFTLIELLVVIVIIGILITLVATNLIGAQEEARKLQATQRCNSVKLALEMWGTTYGRSCYLLQYTFEKELGTNNDNPKNPKGKTFIEEDKMPTDPFNNGKEMIGLGVSDVETNSKGQVIGYNKFNASGGGGEYDESKKDIDDSFIVDDIDGYLIYSVGPNGKDEGGIIGPGADNKYGTDDDEDDIAAYIRF